jgi:co-chaperonin GroES (HSP10)|tara:strand:- start:416 stop:802 length:387 start_codon:yes stop_codon:yes gene_type:complete
MEAEIATNGNGVEEAVTTASQLPEPCGWKILIALPNVEDKTEGGIIKASETLQAEELSTIIGFVMKLGPLAYRDVVRFPTGAWCKEGDFVLMRAYSGTRIKIHGKEFRLINDDTVEAVVDDPRGIAKV